MSECSKCGITDNEISHKQILEHLGENPQPKNEKGQPIDWWKSYASKKTANENIEGMAVDYSQSFWEQTDRMFNAIEYEVICKMCEE